MDNREFIRKSMVKNAASARVAKAPPPFPPPKNGAMGGMPGDPNGGMPGMGGGFDNNPKTRQIPNSHKFDPEAMKPLARMLWAMSVSLGHALQAYRQFNRVKSSTVSPDGLIGGRGFVMKVPEVRQRLYEACEALSQVSDTIHDEINAPHWKPKLGELEQKDIGEVARLMGEAEHMLDHPDEDTDEDMEEVEEHGDKGKDWMKNLNKQKQHKPGLPDGGDAEVTAPSQGGNPARQDRFKQSSKSGLFRRKTAYFFIETNSSVNPDTLPGPRVKHMDRGDTDQTGPGGSVNVDEPPVMDAWGQSGGVSGEPMSDNDGDSNNYPSDWEGDFSEKVAGMPEWPPFTLKDAASGVPDSNSDNTPTEGYDFGVGRGNGNDAHGQGAGGYGQGNPGSGNRGVYGPEARLPDDPGGKTKDREESDTTPQIENSLGDNHGFTAAGELPNDEEEPVARSDYYRGDKGNDMNVVVRQAEAELPGSGAKAKPTPLTARPNHLEEHEFSAGSDLPGDDPGGNATNEYDKDLMDTGYRYERDQPYTKWDDNTHNMRPDFNYQRDPIQGPYPKQTP